MTCAEKPCGPGTCTSSINGFLCSCPYGYSGKYCEIQTDECRPNRCKNNGKCNPLHNDYECLCQHGFLGKSCEINIDDCKNEPCLNGGTCVDMINQYRCQCIPGFIGNNCQNKVDLCLTKPCANGGSCINLNNDYKCTCRPGFTGKDCSVDIDECTSIPCKNGGTCVNRVNSYQCVCPGGFRGQQCEDEAASNPSYDATHISTTQAYNRGSDELSKGQVALIAILSIAMPMVVIVAACVVYCMKRKRKRDQEKEDAEARKQNERNATATLHHGSSSNSSKRTSNTGVVYDNSNPTIIKNTWDKSVNNISTSASVDECLMNSSCFGTNYESDSFSAVAGSTSVQMPPLERAKSQKQLNTDPSLHQRTSHTPHTKDYATNSENKRISCIGISNIINSSNATSGSCMSSMQTDSLLCNPNWPTQSMATTSTSPRKSFGPCNPSHM